MSPLLSILPQQVFSQLGCSSSTRNLCALQLMVCSWFFCICKVFQNVPISSRVAKLPICSIRSATFAKVFHTPHGIWMEKSPRTRLMTSSPSLYISSASCHLPVVHDFRYSKGLNSSRSTPWDALQWISTWYLALLRPMDSMSGSSGRRIGMAGVPYWYLPACVIFTNHMVPMRNFRHATKNIVKCPNSFRFLRGIRSLVMSLRRHWQLCKKWQGRNKCTWNSSTTLSIPTYRIMSKHQHKISQVRCTSLCTQWASNHGRKVDVLTSNSLFLGTTPTLIVPSPEAEDWRI